MTRKTSFANLRAQAHAEATFISHQQRLEHRTAPPEPARQVKRAAERWAAKKAKKIAKKHGGTPT